MWPFYGQRAKRRNSRANALQKWKEEAVERTPPSRTTKTLKIIIFGAKIDAKMGSGGSRNVSVGRWATSTAKNAWQRPPGAPKKSQPRPPFSLRVDRRGRGVRDLGARGP